MSCSEEIDLTKIADSKIEFAIKCEADQIEFEDGVTKPIGEFDFNGTVESFVNYARLKGSLKLPVEIACARCLKPVKRQVDLRIDSALVEPEALDEELDIELETKGLEVSLIEGEKINLAKIGLEQALISLPARLVCKNDCMGLCPECGIDRNADSCNCDEDEIDSRWAALRDLKVK